jgi:hypothetical protein
VPPVTNWINGELSFNQIKSIKIEDLLERDPIKLDDVTISAQLKNKVVLITGAAGSIGSELARQCANYSPKKIYLLDQAESPLHELELEFNEKFKDIYFIDNIDHDTRKEILFQVLNFFRTNYSLDHRLLKNRQETEAFLKNKLDDRKLWSLDKNENIDTPSHLASVVPKQRVRGKFFASMGSRSGIGKYLKRKMEDANVDTLNQEDFKKFIEAVCDLLTRTNFLIKEEFLGGIVKGYQLRTDKIVWLPGDEKTVQTDETRLNTFRDIKLIVIILRIRNQFWNFCSLIIIIIL